jgi:hypothetical protein
VEVFELAETDKLLGAKDIVVKTAKEIRTAGMDPCPI